LAFAKLKAFIKRFGDMPCSAVELVLHAMTHITQEDCLGYFEHAGYF
jgi:hypothetical protein